MQTLFQFQEEPVPTRERQEERDEDGTLGETVAMLLLILLVAAGILLGLWSGIALYTGAVDTGGPIGILVDFFTELPH